MADSDNATGPEKKCPDCPPGLPGWMATFADMVTLLLTFFVLLLSFAKTETAKYEAALGSVRDAFGGNVFQYGKVIQRGKSPDDSPTMLESDRTVKPFPVEFLTMEGILDKHEINRESTEDLQLMKKDLMDFALTDSVQITEVPEGIKVRLKDKIFFKEGTVKVDKISIQTFDRMVKLLANKDWTVFVEGHASRGERSLDGKMDALELSSKRASEVTRSLIRRGVRAHKVTTVYYGDTRPDNIKGIDRQRFENRNRRVEFLVRRTDLRTPGHNVHAQ